LTNLSLYVKINKTNERMVKYLKDFKKFEEFITAFPFYKKFWDITPDEDLDGFLKLPKDTKFDMSDTNDICSMITQISLRIIKEYHEWLHKEENED